MRHAIALFVGLVTFCLGVVSSGVSLPREALDREVFVSPVPQSTPTNLEANTSPAKPDESNDLGCWGAPIEHPTFGPMRLADDRILTTICGTVFVKDRKGNIVWRRNTRAPLTDEPKLINGVLVVIGYDLHLAGLDPTTGENVWELMSNGRAVYVQIEPFGKDTFILLIDMTGYDGPYNVCVADNGAQRKGKDCRRTDPDKVELLRRDKKLGEWTVPAESRVEVIEHRVFAVYRRGKRQERLRIF